MPQFETFCIAVHVIEGIEGISYGILESVSRVGSDRISPPEMEQATYEAIGIHAAIEVNGLDQSTTLTSRSKGGLGTDRVRDGRGWVEGACCGEREDEDSS